VKGKLQKTFQGKYSILAWFSISMVLISIVILIIPYLINISYSYKYVTESIYPEIFGLLFDILIFGIIITFFQILSEKRTSISKEIEIINDFRGWNTEEASHRILGSIKRLNKLNVYNVNLENCYFSSIMFQKLDFCDSKMNSISFFNCNLFNITFFNSKTHHFTIRDSNISGCAFINGNLAFNLHTSTLSNNLFQNIDLRSSRFFSKDISLCIFENVDLSYSYFNFESCSLVEFINCKFDECIVFENFFEKLNKSNPANAGIESISNNYDLIQINDPWTGEQKNVWILRNKNASDNSKPPIRVFGKDETISIISPWQRVGRCQPQTSININ